MMKKRGELTTQQIIILIILIVSFAVILFLLFRLNLGETTDKEICRNSVLMKEKSVLGRGVLDCRTSYVCISGGDDCEDFNEGYKKDIDLSGTDEEIKNETMKAIADEMADCWWMFGEGKVDYVGLDVEGATIGDVNCGVCSVIKFGESLQGQKISYEEFYKYLSQTKKDSQSYLYYLYGSNDISKFDFGDKEFDFSEKYSVLTGIGKLGVLKSIANWFSGFIDVFNKIFFFNYLVGDAPKFKDYGYMPVTIDEQSKINDLNCDNFLTKA